MANVSVIEQCYLKNPAETKLGERIIGASVQLIAELGFEKFTFKRLANHIGSAEASVYRYFENKHKLLLYLIAWYWAWRFQQLEKLTAHITNPNLKLESIINFLCKPVEVDSDIAYINEVELQEIIVAESIKTIHTKEVDDDRKHGYFASFKKFIHFISDCMLTINPEYPYCHNLATMLIDNVQEQQFNFLHFTTLSDLSVKKTEKDLQNFFSHLIFATLKPDV
jgi:AcrR family transcriptional regulator